jgi:hypothetical protein
MKKLTKDLSRRTLISITSFLVAASITLSLTSCETETASRGKGPLKSTAVPGAYYYWDYTYGYVGNNAINRTAGWVTYFYYQSEHPLGQLNLYNLVNQGAPVSYYHLYPGQETYLGGDPYYWVWCMSGKWRIDHGAIVPAE